MRSKVRLINICIRHKCSKVTQDGNYRQFTKKIIRLKKIEPSQYAFTIPTLKKAEDKPVENENREDDVTTNSFAISECISLAALNEEKKDFQNNLCDIHNNLGKITPISISDPETDKKKSCDISEQSNNNNDDVRTNEINIQMLPKSLHKQLFKDADKQRELLPQELNSIKDALTMHGIKTKDATRLPEVDIKLPLLKGDDIEQHFYNIAKVQIDPYLKIISNIIDVVPEMPKNWLLKEGWTRYTANGAEAVEHPLEDGIIFDVEVCLKEGPLPTLATAVTKDAWYGWVSKSVIDGYGKTFQGQSFSMDMMIPLESKAIESGQKLNAFHKKPKIIVGHNVSYDRIRIKEQYWLNCTGTRFLDTMSLHTCVSGINSYQRTILSSKKSNDAVDHMRTYTSLNNLADVHKLYCNSEIDKQARSTFVDGTLADIKKDFNNLMTYCASDVLATHNVLRRLFPIFQERFPHPVTLAGMLELGSAYLPVNSNWQRYIEEAESAFEDLNYEAKLTLAKRADAVCRLMHDEKYKEDPWMWDEDWSTQQIKLKPLSSKVKLQMEQRVKEKVKEQSDAQKYLTDDEDEGDPLEKEFAYLEETKVLLPAKMPHMPGYPAWYRKLCPKINDDNWLPGPQNISTSMKIAPKLLNLTWENYPLHYTQEYGWGILVPYSNNPPPEAKVPLKQILEHCSVPSLKNAENVEEAMSSLHNEVQKDLPKTEFWRFKKKASVNGAEFYKGTGVWCNLDIDNCCYFFKLPHKDGGDNNVGNPLAKDFLNKFSENVLAGLDASATEVLKIARMVSYWRNNRDRIMSQLVVWFEDNCLPSKVKKGKKKLRFGAILPQVVVCGTLTRRAVEPTWMTASNAHVERIGSELRAMIQAPPGYNIVGADVDSQELWIASMIGDAHYKKIHGSTPLGWMTLIGTKSNGTDMHSVTAKAVGISRDHAKVINYARIYGAGQKFAERLLKQFNPSMTMAEAAAKSRKMFTLTKGKKVFKLKPEYVNNDVDDRLYTSYEAYQISKMHAKTLSEMFERGEWITGSESAMFNRLEEIAGSPMPVTPFLGSRLTRALENEKNTEKYLPTKVNWVVQSGAVDFLHLMLVSMRWLMKDNARFCLSFHDEIRYIVPSQYKYNAALAMHITNLLTRSFCASRLGMKDLPMSVAFFSAVEVDTVLRKEAGHDCKTPSNPHGLESGYEISPGEDLDVWTAIEKSGGSVGSWHDVKNTN